MKAHFAAALAVGMTIATNGGVAAVAGVTTIAASRATAASSRSDAACQLAGEWTRDDSVQKVELYQSDSRWFGRLVSSTEKDAKPGFIMFKDFTYDEQKHRFKGTVIVPTSGMQASAELVCVGDSRFKITARKLFITKSFEFNRVEAR